MELLNLSGFILKVKEAKSLSLHLGSSTLTQQDGPPIVFYEELR